MNDNLFQIHKVFFFLLKFQAAIKRASAVIRSQKAPKAKKTKPAAASKKID